MEVAAHLGRLTYRQFAAVSSSSKCSITEEAIHQSRRSLPIADYCRCAGPILEPTDALRSHFRAARTSKYLAGSYWGLQHSLQTDAALLKARRHDTQRQSAGGLSRRVLANRPAANQASALPESDYSRCNALQSRASK